MKVEWQYQAPTVLDSSLADLLNDLGADPSGAWQLVSAHPVGVAAGQLVWKCVLKRRRLVQRDAPGVEFDRAHN